MEELIEILFDQIETGQEFAIAGNSHFTDRQLADMGIYQTPVTQECTHAYRMWKIILENERTWVSFRTNFKEEYLYWEELEQRAGASGYRSVNNVEHRYTEDIFMNFASSTAARDVVFM